MDDALYSEDSTSSHSRGEVVTLGSGGVIAAQESKVLVPKCYKDDDFVMHRGSDLRKAVHLLKEARMTRDSVLPDLLLGISSTILGSFISIFISPQSSYSMTQFVIYLFLGIVMAVTFTIYLNIKVGSAQSCRELAEHVLEYLADTDGEGVNSEP